MWFKKKLIPRAAKEFTVEQQLEKILVQLADFDKVISEQKAQFKLLQDELSSISLWAGMNDYEYTDPKNV